MSLEKARTTQSDIRQYIQNNKLDIMLCLVCLQTVLMIIVLAIILLRPGAASVYRDHQIQELGGLANYARYQQIVHSDAYRQQQTFLIDQKYNIFFPKKASDPTLLSGDLID